MRALSLFSGIGGLDLAAEWAGIETAAFCEIEPYAVKVLERRFQGIENHGDITRFTNRTLRELGGSPFLRFKCPADYNGTIDIVHGGFPCQDLSVAGKQAGLSGARSGLWFEMLRVIAECRPRYAVAENVRGAVNLALDTVCSGLVDEGYEVRALVLPASAFGAPRQRERLFVVGVRSDVADGLQRRLPEAWPEQPPTGAGQHGEGGLNLQTAASLWATPSIAGNYNRKGCSIKAGDGLATQVAKMWPTPSAVDGNNSGRLDEWGGRNNPLRGTELGKGQLNPAWVEILMGYPLGWTDVDCDEPEPWPGWPALMGEKLWTTPNATDYRESDGGMRPSRIATGRTTEYLYRDVHRTTSDQFPYEPPRTVTGCKNRAKRLKCLGNSVVPQQAYPLFRAIAEMEAILCGSH